MFRRLKMSQNKPHIFIVGPSGVGKTTVGKSVALDLGIKFIDLDEAISESVDQSISRYFDQHGEAKFREIERQVLNELVIKDKSFVLATGGGTVLDTRNVAAMKKYGTVVYLSALEEDLVQRVKGDSVNDRPLLSGDLDKKIHEQLMDRRGSFELSADITIATSRRDVQNVTQAVIRQVNRLSGADSELSSSIVVGENILSTLGQYIKHYRRAVLITQESIPNEYKEQISKSLDENKIEVLEIVVPEGEKAKTFQSYTDVIEKMLEAVIPRSACVIALGGGVVGDLSGFVAATYHRGIDIIQVPTTLLAQVDSSIGGKCGINSNVGKNLVGAFLQPKLIFADVKVLDTLSDDDFQSGLGEVVKYGLLGNETVTKIIKDQSTQVINRNSEVLIGLIRSCMNQKLNVVSRDPLEKTGLRATLNLGHTLAHAIENLTKYELAHGKAVALGLRFCIELSTAIGRISQSQKEEAIGLIDSLKLTSQIPQECRDVKVLVEKMYSDKKSSGSLAFVLMTATGRSELVDGVDESIVKETLTRFIESN